MYPRHLPSYFPVFLLLFPLFQPLKFTLSSTTGHSTVNATRFQILQDVLKEISAKQKWDMEGIKILKLEVSKIRFGTALSHQFRVRFGNRRLFVKFPDEVTTWNKLNKSSDDSFEDFVFKEGGSFAALDTFKLDGPFDLWVNEHDDLDLELPLNVSHSGLKRVLVGEGISVEVKKAHEISFFHRFDVKKITGLYPSWDSFSMSLRPVHVIGSASLVAYKSRNPNVGVDSTVLAKGMIELLPEKCYPTNVGKTGEHTVRFLNSTIDRVEKILRSFLGDKIVQNGSSSFIRSNVKASSVIRFLLEVDSDVGSNETSRSMVAEWRTRPIIERVWFDVTARIEDKKLKPLMLKKVRPFVASDSISWSDFMFNTSFTKFPSVLVPPEALTLDVKW